MALPLNNGSDNYNGYTHYQGVILAELASTLFLFIVLQQLHYCMWGHHDEKIKEMKDNDEGVEIDKKEEEPEVS